MKWGDIDHTHHKKDAIVTAPSTPQSPVKGEGPFVGQIVCFAEGYVPFLAIGLELRSFADWWDVEITE